MPWFPIVSVFKYVVELDFHKINTNKVFNELNFCFVAIAQITPTINMESHVLVMPEAKPTNVNVDTTILDNPSLLLDLGAKKGCNEPNFIQVINTF